MGLRVWGLGLALEYKAFVGLRAHGLGLGFQDQDPRRPASPRNHGARKRGRRQEWFRGSALGIRILGLAFYGLGFPQASVM